MHNIEIVKLFDSRFNDLQGYMKDQISSIAENIKEIKEENKANIKTFARKVDVSSNGKQIEKIEDDLLLYRAVLKYKTMFLSCFAIVVVVAVFQIYNLINSPNNFLNKKNVEKASIEIVKSN